MKPVSELPEAKNIIRYLSRQGFTNEAKAVYSADDVNELLSEWIRK